MEFVELGTCDDGWGDEILPPWSATLTSSSSLGIDPLFFNPYKFGFLQTFWLSPNSPSPGHSTPAQTVMAPVV